MHSAWSGICKWMSAKFPILAPGSEGISSGGNKPVRSDRLDGVLGAVLGGMLRSSEQGAMQVHNRKKRNRGGAANVYHLHVLFAGAFSKAWYRMLRHGSSPFAAATWPPLVNPLPSEASEALHHYLLGPPTVEDVSSTVSTSTKIAEMVKEPQSGTQFPSLLMPSNQVLAGVGLRCKQLLMLKSVNIYAFGLYVHPESLRAELGRKYAGVSPEDLKSRPEFYDDLLRHEVNLSLRLVVLYKGLTPQLVRSAFEASLQKRLDKIEGANRDGGLDAFCSYLSEDLQIRKGSVIDIHWRKGGKLQTIVDGRQIGTISSKHLCRAFFDLYIGDLPVSANAKHSMGESFAKLLT